MRVLMVNRPDAFTVPGGDTLQMVETASELKRLGVSVDVVTVDSLENIGCYELLHVFNWEQLEPVLQRCNELRCPLPPIVLSPIFSFQTGHWYDQGVKTKPVWRFIRGLAGDRSSRAMYDWWQERKLRRSAAGRRIRACFSIPKRLLPNSRRELEYAQAIVGVEPGGSSGYSVIPNGVSRELYESLPPSDLFPLTELPERRFVLQVSRIQSEKNQLGLIEALYSVDVPIVFVGLESPYEPEYVRRCKELANERGDVYFLGKKPPEELPSIYARAAVHVLPSWRESQGLVTLEAAAAGCKVVSTLIGGTRDYFGDQIHYCDPREPASIRQAVKAAMDEPSGNALRKLVLGNYTWDIAASLTLQAYRQALA